MHELEVAQKLTNQFVPYYYQIANLLQRKMEQGELPPGTKLPRELELAGLLGVSRVTLRQALAILEEEGLISRERRRGTFVKQLPRKPKSIRLTGIVWEDDHYSEGHRVLSMRNVPPPPILAEFFGISPREPVTRVQRLRLANKTAFSYVLNYIPKELGTRITRKDIKNLSMLEILKRRLHIPLGKIHQTFEARIADHDVAKQLSLEIMEPVMYVETFVYTKKGDPIEFSQIYYRGNQHKYSIELVSE